MSTKRITYPTPLHRQASEAIVKFFSKFEKVKAILLVGSCARSKASKVSCLDIAILLNPQSFAQHKKTLENRWQNYYEDSKVFKSLLAIDKYSHVDLDFINGQFSEGYHGWTSGPDAFELEIGNFLQYSFPLYESGNYFNGLKKIWLPYYDENRRLKRLRMVLKYCHNNLDHIPSFVDRGLYFQAFNRFYDAYREFLQALFISKKIYPERFSDSDADFNVGVAIGAINMVKEGVYIAMNGRVYQYDKVKRDLTTGQFVEI